MTPPVRLPSDGDERDRIEVWLRIPDGARIQGRKLADGRATIELPPGTVADRVESWGYARDESGGWQYTRHRRARHAPRRRRHGDVPRLRAHRPRAARAPRRLGVAPRRRGGAAGGDVAAARATSGRCARIQPQSDDDRRRYIRQYRRNNDCARCHAHDKPVQTARAQGIHRATDHNGFYVPLGGPAGDRAPRATSPPRHERRRSVPHVHVPRRRGPTLAEARRRRPRLPLPRRRRPVGDPRRARALAAGDARTVALCRSRAWLRERMDDTARALFAPAFAACGL